MNIIFRVLAPAVVLGLLLSGCGGGSTDTESTPIGATRSDSTASTAPTAARAAMALQSTSLTPEPEAARPPSTAYFANPISAKSMVGTNLTAVVSYSSEYPFVDVMKQARPWFSGTGDDDPDGQPDFDDGRPLAEQLFPNGDVESLLSDQVARTVLFDVVDPDLANRVFDVFYEGTGNLDIGPSVNVDVEDISAGHRRIRLKEQAPGTKQTVIFTLSSTDSATPLRNLRVLPLGGICVRDPLNRVADSDACPTTAEYRSFAAYDGTIIFNPDFLRRIQKYRGVRFMDWMRTNEASTITRQSFADRPKKGDAFWSTSAGVPLEVMITLANLMDMDPWFNIPHWATNDYVDQFATIVRDKLDSSRKVTIEYSNEVWNEIFDQNKYVRDRGFNSVPSLHYAEDGNDENRSAGHRFYSRRARQIMVRFGQVFADSASPPSLNRVMATQFVRPELTTLILGFENASAHLDQFAVAPYFGGVITTGDERSAVIASEGEALFDWILKNINPTLSSGQPTFQNVNGSLTNTRALMVEQRDVVQGKGLTLTAYEGGQHFVIGTVFRPDPDLNRILKQVNNDDVRMRRAYEVNLTHWLNVTGQPFYHFNNVEQWGQAGYWGALRYQTQPQHAAPKYDTLMKFIDCNLLGQPRPSGCD
jgi:hypothetical protein